MSLAEFFSFDEPVREERYVFRGGEQPDLGRNGLRMLLVGASVEGRQMRMLRELYAPAPIRASRSCMPRAKNVAWSPAAP